MQRTQRTLAVALSLTAVTLTLGCLEPPSPSPLPSPSPVRADAITPASNELGPSRAETLEFLRSFIQARMDDRGYWHVEAVEADECILRILYVKGRDRLLTFDLSDLDPQTIRADGTREVLVETTNALPKIIWQVVEWEGSTPHETDKVEKWTSLDMPMRTHEDQRRLLRALQHGVAVCGGKVAPF